MSRLPLRALDIQLDLLRYYETDVRGRSYADTVIQVAVPDPDDWIPGMGRQLHRKILTGDTFAVTDEIIAVLEQAAPSLPPFVFHRDDLPTDNGFVWLEHPIVILDRSRKPVVLHAFGWHVARVTPADMQRSGYILVNPDGTEASEADIEARSRPALMLVAWTLPSDPRDYASIEWSDAAELLMEHGSPHGLMSMIIGFWPFNEDWHSTNGADPFMGRFFMALLRFMEERWVDNSTVTLPRYERKRLERSRARLDFEVPEPGIRIIQLRRAAERAPSEPGSGVDWSHRWLVRTHWRNQWYPSLGVHKPKLILEYIKGPDGLPLVVHDKIFSVER